jgi:hypothetical protein
MDESVEPAAPALDLGRIPAGVPDAFPWPPAEDENVVFAAGETWRMSLFEPVRFFASMPARGYVSALAYALPVGIIGAGLDLFWNSTFDLLGVTQRIGGWWSQQPPANPALQRLMFFLISPISTLILLFLTAGLLHATLRIMGAAHRPYATTVRVSCFALGPTLFAIVPVVGPLVGTGWSLVLLVLGLREAHGTSTARALAALVIPALLLFTAFLFVLLLIALGAALGWILPAL